MKIIRYIVVLVLIQTNIFAKRECNDILEYYNLNVTTKSYKGWMRVCNNNKLDLYIDKKISTSEKNEICNCFYYDYSDRDVTINKDKK